MELCCRRHFECRAERKSEFPPLYEKGKETACLFIQWKCTTVFNINLLMKLELFKKNAQMVWMVWMA